MSLEETSSAVDQQKLDEALQYTFLPFRFCRFYSVSKLYFKNMSCCEPIMFSGHVTRQGIGGEAVLAEWSTVVLGGGVFRECMSARITNQNTNFR